MISCPKIQKRQIRSHYDLSTVFYRLLWGQHIHHGLWRNDEPAVMAQQHLIDVLARHAQIRPGESVLDVGCGMGGSSIYLSRSLGCRVTGITLSPLQANWSRVAAQLAGASRAQFFCRDAEASDFASNSFDVLWTIECTEHFFDKGAFFAKSAAWLRPGGRLAVCAWVAGEAVDQQQTRLVEQVCEGFLCPSLGTCDDYRRWITSAGLQIQHVADWTDRVARTWEICRERVQRSRIRALARLLDQDTVQFLDHFDTILAAYRTGAMRYACLVARRPIDRDFPAHATDQSLGRAANRRVSTRLPMDGSPSSAQ